MKRIVGRKIIKHQSSEYPVEIYPVDINALPDLFRYRWASGIIDSLMGVGVRFYNALDIGSCNGAMSAYIALKDSAANGRIHVDAIESHRESYDDIIRLSSDAAKLGAVITPHNVEFGDYETTKVYDIIIAFEVLEHTSDPLFCIEKIYDLLEIGGYALISVPEESGMFGLSDNNRYHYWVSTVQSLVAMFSDDQKWTIKHVFENDGIILMMVRKRTYQG